MQPSAFQRPLRAALGYGILGAFQFFVASPAAAESGPHSSNNPPCDGTIAALFKPDADTRVVQVAHFKKGDPLTFGPDQPAKAQLATNDLCMVKLIVGPGNPGPEGAASTSEGIGIEIWLPDRANWNGRLHALGGGGWQGGPAGVASLIARLASALVV